MGLNVEQRFADVLESARQMHPDAYFFTGDFCAHEPVRDVYIRLQPILASLERPFYLIAGNHDDRQMMRDVFDLPGSGQDPIHYRRVVAGRSFVFLDTSPGVVGDAQVQWLAEELREAPDSDIVMHHPPVELGINFMDRKYPLRDTQELYRVLTEDGVARRVFCGHYHSERTVVHKNLEVNLCPPTSFFIDPRPPKFELFHRPPGYQLLEWTDTGDFRRSSVVVGAQE